MKLTKTEVSGMNRRSLLKRTPFIALGTILGVAVTKPTEAIASGSGPGHWVFEPISGIWQWRQAF